MDPSTIHYPHVISTRTVFQLHYVPYTWSICRLIHHRDLGRRSMDRRVDGAGRYENESRLGSLGHVDGRVIERWMMMMMMTVMMMIF